MAKNKKNKQVITLKWTEKEFEEKYSIEWENSIKITSWEHDFENHSYTIKYTE